MKILPDSDPAAARRHFDRLTRDEVVDAVQRLASEGHSDYGIAAATGIAVEQIRNIIAGGEGQSAADCNDGR